MDDRAALLRAICLDPADDTVRLVYADYLDEHGEPEYAEFIRVQIQLARLDPEPECAATEEGLKCNDPSCSWAIWHSKGFRLHQRERELLENQGHGGWWKFAGLSGANVFDEVIYERGFAIRVTATCANFLAHAGSLFLAHPIKKVKLTDRNPGMTTDGEFYYYWSVTYHDHLWLSLPKALHSLLDGYDGKPNVNGTVYYTSALGAFDALNAACILFGRTRAGLLPSKEVV